MLGRKGNGGSVKNQALAKEQAQLVLGRDHDDLGAGLLEFFEDGRRPQPFRIIHHGLEPGHGIDEIVSADAVNRRRRPGHDRKVVGIGKAWNDAMSAGVFALGNHFLEIRHQAFGHGYFHVVRLAAIAANDHERGFWPVIIPSVHRNGFTG